MTQGPTPATRAGQDTGNASLSSIDGKTPALVSGRQPVDGSGVTQPVSSAASSQADGHSATLGATADADTALTIVGRVKKLVSLLAGGLPAALGAGGGIKVDGSGTPLPVSGIVSPGTATQAIYTTTIPTLIPAANATDVLVITGSASKVVRVMYLELFIEQTTAAGRYNWFIYRRSTDDTGTGISLTPRNRDTNDPNATAVCREYQANPTLGTSAGIFQRARIFHADATNPIDTSSYTFDFTRGGLDKGVVLRGTSEIMALNFGGAAVPAGLTLYGQITHSEE